MRITTLDHVNGRTSDGRVYSAGAGAVTDVDDDDAGMVALMRDLAKAGLVEIAEPKPKLKPEREPEPERKKAVVEAPAEPKKAVTRPRTGRPE